MLIRKMTPSTDHSKAREKVATNNITQSQIRDVIMIPSGIPGNKPN